VGRGQDAFLPLDGDVKAIGAVRGGSPTLAYWRQLKPEFLPGCPSLGN
jgi:hypothetical protein